ncbi:hypothetical protein MED121_08623 [Marinomonas sp. MED121]|uniref:hypothetical protein n=1 Tax=Marinomonas sp. MED121 TaxID=314277 RepID=UPI00006900FB|nr:hypothetical protein [Marinomonas sp. MED121]EAQ65615.1 hypothetical protein MED121_08623 [Marinomonas sp. MED121]
MINTIKFHIIPQLFQGSLIGVYLGLIYINFSDKILNIQDLSLAELGSFSGGVFAPIAVFLLIVQHRTQHKELLKSKNKEIKREEIKTKLAQPLFEFKSCYLNDVEDITTGKCHIHFAFEIENHLADATEVFIRIKNLEAGINQNDGKVKKIFRGDCCHLHIVLDQYSVVDNFDIEMTYYDSLREFRTSKHTFIRDTEYFETNYGSHQHIEIYSYDMKEN